MSRFTRWMPAVLWRPLPAGAPAGEPQPAGHEPFRIVFPLKEFCREEFSREKFHRKRFHREGFHRKRFHRAHTRYSRPFLPWPCLIRSGRAVVAPEEVAPEGAEAEVAVAERVEAVQEAVVEVVPAVGVVPEAERVAPAEVREVARGAERVEVALGAVLVGAARAAEVTTRRLITTTRRTISHGPSCRNSHLRLRPISKSWRRWRKERAVSRFSIPMTCSPDLNESGVNRMSFIFWATCPVTLPKEAATPSK